MFKPIVLIWAALGLGTQAHGFSQEVFEMATETVVAKQAGDRFELQVSGSAEIDGSIESVSGAVKRLNVQGLLPDGKTDCKKQLCSARLKYTEGSLSAVVEYDGDQDGNIDKKVTVPVGRIDSGGVLQTLGGVNLKANYVQYSVRPWERTDGQKNQSYVSLTLTFQ